MTAQLLRMREVEAITGLSKSTIYNYMNDGRFPRPVWIGRNTVRFRASAIQQWISELADLCGMAA